jgi:hypothetical protein
LVDEEILASGVDGVGWEMDWVEKDRCGSRRSLRSLARPHLSVIYREELAAFIAPASDIASLLLEKPVRKIEIQLQRRQGTECAANIGIVSDEA